ncbi:MAG: nitroreductase family protein [Sinobacteraceae bacterium]|nr:nitroreductase family protein [Nevskiaceae bacterium]
MSIRRFESSARMSQAVVANGVVYLAGQVADDTTADVEGQTRQVLAEIDRLLALVGTDKRRILSANIYLADIGDFAAMNRAWEAWVASDAKPARATIEAKLAAPKYRVEVQVTALAGEASSATPADVLETIMLRSSATKLVEPAPDRAQLETLLRAAVRAPDHGRLAPWRFAVLQGEARARLGEAMAEVLRQRTPDVAAEVLDGERRKALRAPVVIAVAVSPQPLPKIPEVEQIAAVAAGIENLILAAHALGFGSMWKTGPAAYNPIVNRALGFEPTDRILGFVYLGTAVTRAPVRAAEIDAVTRWL